MVILTLTKWQPIKFYSKSTSPSSQKWQPIKHGKMVLLKSMVHEKMVVSKKMVSKNGMQSKKWYAKNGNLNPRLMAAHKILF